MHQLSKLPPPELLRALEDRCDRYPGVYPPPRVAAYYSLTEVQRIQIAEISRAAAIFLDALVPALRQSKEAIERVVVDGEFRDVQIRLIGEEPSEPSPFLARLDCVWDEAAERFWICEINADAVGGVEDAYLLRKVYKEFLGADASGSDPAGRHLAQFFSNAHSGQPGRVVYTDDFCLHAGTRLAEMLRAEGAEADCVHLNDLRDGPAPSWIYRHLLLSDLFSHEGTHTRRPEREAVRHFFELIRDPRTSVYCPLGDRLAFDKRYLIEEVALRHVSAQSWAPLGRWIPATRYADPQELLDRGEVPEGVVLKPTRGFGGSNVCFPGDPLPDFSAIDDDWILQDLIDGESLQVLGDPRPHRAVHGLHLLAGKYVGDHIRVSPGFRVSAAGGWIPALDPDLL